MTEALVNRVKISLKEKFYIMNDSWLRECIEYYTSENSNAGLNAIEAFVTSQWLLSDLREINNEKGYLPRDFYRQEKIMLPGKYIVQVEKMYDISQSKYNQMQKIRNVSEVNIKATTIETPAWEPKGKRTMQMFLTDGIQDFSAIEYRPIKALKDTLLPGFKLMIVGPVMCRKGLMLLEDKNYKEIGGEVESLLKVNALENVLARKLGMEENENPYGDENVENNEQKTEIQFPEDEFDIDLDEINQIEQLSMESEEPFANIPSSSAEHFGNNGTVDNRIKNKRETKNIIDLQPNLDIHNVDRLNPILDQRKSKESHSEIKSRAQLKPLITGPSDFQLPDDNFLHDDCLSAADFEDDLDENMLRGNSNQEIIAGKNVPKISEANQRIESSILSTKENSGKNSPTLSTGKRSADTLSPVDCPSKIICLQTKSETVKKNRKITEFTEKLIPKEHLPHKMCDFICDILKESTKGTVFKTVRGKVSEIGNLTKVDHDWILTATITDDTASLKIVFSTQVLEDLIGFSVPEFLEKRKLRKKNPEVEEYLRKGFRTAELKVQKMDVLMELEFSDNSLPKVVDTRELTEEQKQLIDKRMKMLIV